MLNLVVLQGRLVSDPEIRLTQSGIKVANIRLAVDSDYRKKEGSTTGFFNVIAWRNSAEFIESYVKKGQMILVRGSLQNREWTDNDGKKRSVVEVLADNINFCDSKKSNTDTQQGEKRFSFNPPAEKDQELPF